LAFGSVITNTSTPGLPLASPPTRTFSTESTLAEIRQPHDCAVFHRDDERHVVDGLEQLVVRVDFPARAFVGELSLRPVRIRLREHGAHLLERDAVFVQHRRVQLDANRRQRAAAHVDLTDAAHLRQILREHGRCDVVDLAAYRVGRAR
jgi:hypothetical protein